MKGQKSRPKVESWGGILRGGSKPPLHQLGIWELLGKRPDCPKMYTTLAWPLWTLQHC